MIQTLPVAGGAGSGAGGDAGGTSSKAPMSQRDPCGRETPR